MAASLKTRDSSEKLNARSNALSGGFPANRRAARIGQRRVARWRVNTRRSATVAPTSLISFPLRSSKTTAQLRAKRGTWKACRATLLAKSGSHAARRERFRQIESKARWRNRNFVFTDRWFVSSQLCSECGDRHQELSLSDRFWTCPVCGVRHDRDHNAAINVRDEGVRILLAVGHTERINACGASVRPATAGRSQ